MSPLRFKSKVSKNELVRQRREDTMVNALFEAAVRQNTCQCGHWAIRHLRIFGSPCKEKDCQCWAFRPLLSPSPTDPMTGDEPTVPKNWNMRQIKRFQRYWDKLLKGGTKEKPKAPEA